MGGQRRASVEIKQRPWAPRSNVYLRKLAGDSNKEPDTRSPTHRKPFPDSSRKESQHLLRDLPFPWVRVLLRPTYTPRRNDLSRLHRPKQLLIPRATSLSSQPLSLTSTPLRYSQHPPSVHYHPFHRYLPSSCIVVPNLATTPPHLPHPHRPRSRSPSSLLHLSKPSTSLPQTTRRPLITTSLPISTTLPPLPRALTTIRLSTLSSSSRLPLLRSLPTLLVPPICLPFPSNGLSPSPRARMPRSSPRVTSSGPRTRSFSSEVCAPLRPSTSVINEIFFSNRLVCQVQALHRGRDRPSQDLSGMHHS